MLFLVFGLLIVVIVFLVAYAALISTIHGKSGRGRQRRRGVRVS